MTRLRAPFFRGHGKVDFVPHEYREPGAGELLVAPRANALCGSDRGSWEHGADHVPGHETAGVVLEAGPDTSITPGTHGVIFLMDFCGRCRSCRTGATNQCLSKRADYGIADDGGLGPLELISESVFFPIPDDLDFGRATALLDVMGTSGHAISRAQLVQPDIESVFIGGAGPIGLGLLIMTKLRLGRDVPVYISDLSGWRRSFAESLGGLPVDPGSDASLRSVGTVDVAFDASGRQAARRQELELLAQRGALVCVGHGEELTVDVSRDLIAPEHAVLGSEYFRFDELAANLDLLLTHEQYVGQLITHRFPIDQIADAYQTFFSGETGKVVVEQEER